MRRNPYYRFLININENHLEVHDLDNEQTGDNECQIDEIISSGNARYIPGTTILDLERWLAQHTEYDGCKYCLPQYHRK